MDELLTLLKGCLPRVDFTDPDGLIDRGALDSLDIVTIVDEIGDHYGVDVPSALIKPQNFNSVQAIYGIVAQLTKDK